MVAPNEFWLQLHQLAAAYDAEGLNTAQRAENILAQLRGLSPLTQKQLASDLLRLTVHLPAIYSLVIAERRQAQHKKAALSHVPRNCVA